MNHRIAEVSRTTAETDVDVALDIDGGGLATNDTGIEFLDHMLDCFAVHGLVDLRVTCDGDLDVDTHHTIEDVAIVFGDALNEAIDANEGIERFAHEAVPMDDSIAVAVLDVSDRPFFEFTGEFSQTHSDDVPTQMFQHFFRSLAMNAGFTLHLAVSGENAHHEVEALFKAVARAIDDATRRDSRRFGMASTK